MSRSTRIPNRRTRWFLAALSLAITAAGCAREKGNIESDVESIRTLIFQQQDDWNNGDVDAFMEGYLKSDSLRFASGGSFRYGWQKTLDRYHSAYPDRAAMGRLTFSDLDIDRLSAEWAMAFGSWHLERSGEYDDIGGLFTLILVRTENGWRIKFDHTSTAD